MSAFVGIGTIDIKLLAMVVGVATCAIARNIKAKLPCHLPPSSKN